MTKEELKSKYTALIQINEVSILRYKQRLEYDKLTKIQKLNFDFEIKKLEIENAIVKKFIADLERE